MLTTFTVCLVCTVTLRLMWLIDETLTTKTIRSLDGFIWKLVKPFQHFETAYYCLLKSQDYVQFNFQLY